MKNAPPSALMIYAASERDADLYYATGFVAPDPFLYFRVGGRSHILVSDLEYGRARKESTVNRVETYSLWEKRAKKGGAGPSGFSDVVKEFLRAHSARHVGVPQNFPLGLAESLRRKGVAVEPRPEPFWAERAVKTRRETDFIEATLRHTEAAIRLAENVLRASRIRGNRIFHKGRMLTCEYLRSVIDGALLERRCVAGHTIVAGGDQGCDPHCEGRGPVRPNASLVLDVFPRSSESLYFADITRTFVKGKASTALRAQYEAVKAGQQAGLDRVREGANGLDVHRTVRETMEGRGYKTERRRGVMVGFFHGTGHGVGLEIHEAPRVNQTDHVLRSGEVVTIEPGLYYPGVGAVRLEDLVVVTKGGCRNLTKYPKRLELD